MRCDPNTCTLASFGYPETAAAVYRATGMTSVAMLKAHYIKHIGHILTQFSCLALSFGTRAGRWAIRVTSAMSFSTP